MIGEIFFTEVIIHSSKCYFLCSFFFLVKKELTYFFIFHFPNTDFNLKHVQIAGEILTWQLAASEDKVVRVLGVLLVIKFKLFAWDAF